MLVNTRSGLGKVRCPDALFDIPLEFAANGLLDRAFGKPAVKEETEIVDLPPVVIQLTGPTN